MVTAPPPVKTAEVNSEIQETALTPRFYITDFEAAANLDLSARQNDLEVMLNEMRADYNRYHFVRDDQFKQTWEHIDAETRSAFKEFLERSCISEFSGFLLFKELSRHLKERNPLLSEIFHLMARDEARHAGFLNKAMNDFNFSLDLRDLTKSRTYTFFPLSWVIYTVYLSEKIGYWRYIIMFRHLEAHPENKFYPLFNYFESWCQDENRHGDIFKALLRSQPRLWNNWRAKLWIRFFLLSVFATHTMTVHERSGFYHSVGLDPTEYDRQVLEKTNETSGRAFPLILNLQHPQFFRRLHRCSDYNKKLGEIGKSKQPKIIKIFRQFPFFCAIIWNLLRLYLIKPIEVESLRGTVR
ncbi:MAG: magnesium-protoporphyrin IX monomethyl ester (oxidative) cyclase [Kamptonema sp. SIO1D9]|nr:magnesium-protoporphyrin IX monomethyl ester (oxidative) cyclase [Kamptonema sp. SIO1D9]